MKTIPSLSPKHAELSRANSGITSTLETITQDICDCLGEESRKTLKEKTETLAELLGQLQDEIERKREKINYDYSFEDYKKRIGQSDEVLQRVFEERVLGDENIRSLYEALLESVDVDTREVLKYKLWEEYFEDLVYVSMEEGNYEMDEKNVNLTDDNLRELNEKQLQIIFENLRNVKSVVFERYNLAKIDENKLQIIFKNLRNVKSIDLTGNNLGKCNQQQLQAIFENLRNVKCIDISINNLHELDEERVSTIFENLRNVKSVNLSWNNLLNLDEKRGRIIFENLRNVKSVVLWGNILSKFAETQLQIIFENLTKTEKIHIAEYPEYAKKIVSMFPYLKDKIINKI